MGWWPFSPESRGDAIRSGNAIPTRAERAVCWASRDAFFACLDSHDIVDTTKDPGAADARRHCAAAMREFERDCSAAWVKYFKQWRVADVQKRRRLEELRAQGATEMTVTSSFADNPSSQPRSGGPGKQDIRDMVDKRRN